MGGWGGEIIRYTRVAKISLAKITAVTFTKKTGGKNQ